MMIMTCLGSLPSPTDPLELWREPCKENLPMSKNEGEGG